MNIKISPSVAQGQVRAPASKSYAHRLLICAALSQGVSVIENIGTNDDIVATVSCLKEMGAKIDVMGTTATVEGISFGERKESVSLFCNESGSTLRFLIPLTLLVANEVFFSGAGRLMERPQTVFEELFKAKGCFLAKEENRLKAGGELKSGVYELRGDVSSQFITGLLFTLPLLSGDSEIRLTTPLQSAPYIDITIDALSHFGVNVEQTDKGYFIKGSQKYVSQNISCEGDWSNSAFLHAFNLVGGSVYVKGLNPDSYQGDKVYRDFYDKLNVGTPTIDISDCPDLGPVLMACAAMKNGATLTGTQRLKIKESDRGSAMKQELLKLGVSVEIGEDYIKISKAQLNAPTESIDCHNDHRIAMSMAVLCSVTGGTLNNAQCVNKSYPDFFEDIKNLGITYNII